jgi:hypothetical protein
MRLGSTRLARAAQAQEGNAGLGKTIGGRATMSASALADIDTTVY